MKKEPVEIRFQRKYVKDLETGCWLWTGGMDAKGYGMVSAGRMKRAHRVSYEIHVGAIPEGLQLDHLCRVHNCVNPKHLEPVTPLENTRRGFGNWRKTQCPKGHDYNEANTRHYRGRRFCRKCESWGVRHPRMDAIGNQYLAGTA